MPYFSVVIPLFNKEKYIFETLNSVLNQNFQDFEVIIVNDGSTDNSLAVIEKFSDKRLRIINQKNKGVSIARNRGITEAKANFITLLDADDLWYLNHLKEFRKQIELFPQAGLYCNNYEILYNENVKRPAHLNFSFGKDCLLIPDFFKASIANPVAWTSGVAFPKTVFNTIGKFNTELITAQDLDLWIRIALEYKVSFNPEITMSYRLHVDDSLSKRELNTIRHQFISKFKNEELQNDSLKLYLDINRYAVALRSKLNGEKEIYRILKSEIDSQNLNLKQRFLLNSPPFLIRKLKTLQKFLIKGNIYITAFK